MAMGRSFSPGESGQQSALPVQDAIRLLSFRLPTTVGAGAPSPPALLAGGAPPPMGGAPPSMGGGASPEMGMGGPMGGGGMGGGGMNPGVLQWLRQIFLGLGQPGGGLPNMAPGGGSAPTPSISYSPGGEHAPGPQAPQSPGGWQGGPAASAPGPQAPTMGSSPWGDWQRQERGLGGGPQRFGG
jgi:hypothetical protein